jgi:hypothetical protein
LALNLVTAVGTDTRIVFAVILRIFLSGALFVLVKDWMRGRGGKEEKRTDGKATKVKKEVAYVTKKKPEVAVQRGNASGYV